MMYEACVCDVTGREQEVEGLAGPSAPAVADHHAA